MDFRVPEVVKMPKAVRGSAPSNPGLSGDIPFKIPPFYNVLVGRARRKTVFFQVKSSFAIKLDLTFLEHFSHYMTSRVGGVNIMTPKGINRL